MVALVLFRDFDFDHGLRYCTEWAVIYDLFQKTKRVPGDEATAA